MKMHLCVAKMPHNFSITHRHFSPVKIMICGLLKWRLYCVWILMGHCLEEVCWTHLWRIWEEWCCIVSHLTRFGSEHFTKNWRNNKRQGSLEYFGKRIQWKGELCTCSRAWTWGRWMGPLCRYTSGWYWSIAWTWRRWIPLHRYTSGWWSWWNRSWSWATT